MRPGRKQPILFLRVEGATLLGLAIFLYVRGERGWLLFALLILAPDVSMLGYLAGNRVGAVAYNVFHTYLPPAILAVLGLLGDRLLVALAMIWFAHIGMDRMLGYGLKLPTDFRDTHLGRIGRG